MRRCPTIPREDFVAIELGPLCFRADDGNFEQHFRDNR